MSTSVSHRAAPSARKQRRHLGVTSEILVAAVVSLAVSVGMNWGQVIRLGREIPGEGVDPFIELWSLAWSAHALHPSVPGGVFDANAFYPAHDSLAFTDSLLGFGPLAGPFGPGHMVLAMGLIFLLGSALSSLGAYALARQLGANWLGSAVAGAAFAYPPWRLGQINHLHVLTTGPLVLAFALLARGHALRWRAETPSRNPGPKPLWVLLGWLMACWQLTIGFAQGLPFAYLLGGLGMITVIGVSVHTWSRGRPAAFTWRLAAANGAGVTAFAAAGVFMAMPYLRVQAANPGSVRAARGPSIVRLYSPHWEGLVTPPSAPGTWSWLTQGTIQGGTNEARVLPGVILLLLALGGLLLSCWRVPWRASLLVLVLGLGALTLGSTLHIFGHSPFFVLHDHAPGWASDRTSGRLITFTTLALALLAAGFVTAVMQRWRPRVLLLSVLPVLILAEGWGPVPTSAIPPVPRAVREATGPMVVLPSLWNYDSRVMYWTAEIGFPKVGNGASGITPGTVKFMRGQVELFPDLQSVAYLRAYGFRSVVVLKQNLGTTRWHDAGRVPEPDLGLIRTEYPDSILYTLR